MSIRLQSDAIDPEQEARAFREQLGESGALVTFTGIMRGKDGEREISAMTLEHYPGMTEKSLKAIEEEARTRWPLDKCLIIHRFGKMTPGEPILFLAVATRHRRQAFEAAEFLIDWLKTKAPFWKYEENNKGGEWVKARAEDDEAADSWN